MKQSARARRLAKHHKRFATGNKLNLVALMDIFTILVFFLIVNQSEVRVLQNIKEISLPVSIAEELPVENLVITVLDNSVIIQERAVWQRSEQGSVSDEYIGLIEAVKTELTYQANKRPQLTETEQEKGRAVTIIGDASIPYQVLKQIMAACADTGYRNMSLAVERQAKQGQGEG